MKPVTIKVTSEFFDLVTFEDVRVVKEQAFTPAESTDAALAILGNDNARLLAVINKGLMAEAKTAMAQSADGWHTYNEDGTVNGAYAGTPADSKKVGPFLLNIAKNVFGFGKDLSKEEKRKRKEMAADFVKGNEQMRAGLAANCALDLSEDE